MAALVLLLRFLKAVVVSGLQTVGVILRSQLRFAQAASGRLCAGALRAHERRKGAALLGCMVTLTPGTTTIDIDMERANCCCMCWTPRHRCHGRGASGAISSPGWWHCSGHAHDRRRHPLLVIAGRCWRRRWPRCAWCRGRAMPTASWRWTSFLAAAVALCVGASLATARTVFLDVAIGLALVGFVATVGWARLVDKGGRT
jgi:hypothetical protein